MKSAHVMAPLHLQQLFTMLLRFYNPYNYHYKFSDDILKVAIDVMQKSRHIIVKHFILQFSTVAQLNDHIPV